MAVTFTRVTSGQLIKAEFFNQVLDEIERLGRAVDGMANGSTPSRLVLYDIVPHGPVQVGTRITVIGGPFLLPGQLNETWVGGVRVPDSSFKSMSDVSNLVFDIPVFGVTAGGADTTVDVKNQFGTGHLPIRLLPEVKVPQGRIELAYSSPPILPAAPNNKIAPGTYVFVFTVNPAVDPETTYDVKATIGDQATWTAELWEDVADKARSGRGIALPSGADRSLRVAVTIPAGTGNVAGKLRVEVTDASGGSRVLPGVQETTITVGAEPPMPQTGVRVSGRTLTGATLDGSRVKLAGPGIITFNLKFERTGHYTIAASAPAGWKPEEPDPKNIFAQTAPTDQPVAVGLTPPSATSAGDLTLTISSSDATPAVAVQYVQPITH